MSGSVLTHGKKVAQKKILKFNFGLKHPKITTPNGEVKVVSVLFLKLLCPFPKNQKCSFITRIALLFSKSAHLFPRSVFFLFTVCVKNAFFPQLIVPSTCPAQRCSDR